MILSILLPICAGAAQQHEAGARKESARQVTDEVGRQVAVPAEVRRIVSLAPNLTEILYDLGVADRVVGVSNYSDFPAAASTKPRVGDPVEPSLEQIVALRPDLVLATTEINRRETADALAKLGFAVYATNPKSVEGMLDSIAHIGDLAGAGAAGETIVKGLRARLEDLKRRLSGHAATRVVFVVWETPLITTGPHTFLADALRWAGAQPLVDAAQDWPRISLEELARLNPEYIVLEGSHRGKTASASEELRTQPGWRDLEAVRSGRVVVAGEAIMRPCPRMVEAIEKLAQALHPEVFEKKMERSL